MRKHVPFYRKINPMRFGMCIWRNCVSLLSKCMWLAGDNGVIWSRSNGAVPLERRVRRELYEGTRQTKRHKTAARKNWRRGAQERARQRRARNAKTRNPRKEPDGQHTFKPTQQTGGAPPGTCNLTHRENGNWCDGENERTQHSV